MDLIDIYGTLHPTTAKYTFFSTVRGNNNQAYTEVVIDIDHMLGYKVILNKVKRF